MVFSTADKRSIAGVRAVGLTEFGGPEVLRVLDRSTVNLDLEMLGMPDEIHELQGTYGITPGLWSDFTGRDAVTDKDGRFRLEGVLPGVRFALYVSDGDLREERTLVARRQHVRVEPGKAADLGVLRKGEGVRQE